MQMRCSEKVNHEKGEEKYGRIKTKEMREMDEIREVKEMKEVNPKALRE